MRFPTRFRSMPEVEQTTSELQWSQQKRPTTLFKLKSQWNSSIFNVSFSDCLILWSCSLLSNCNLLTIVASILFFSECHVIFIKARILLKNPVIFVLSDFGWSWIPPKNLRLWPRGAWFSVPKKSCWAERNLAGWKLASRLESAFHCMPPQKKRFAVVIMKNAKRWQGKKNLNMSFILGTFLHLFSLTKLLILWTFLCQKKKPFTADSAWNQSERVNKSPRPKHSS